MKHGLLIDMDGVIYHGSEMIPGADRFIDELHAHQIPFLFLTNNSQRTRRDVARLPAFAHRGRHVEPQPVFL